MSQVTSQNALVKDSTVQTLNGKLDNLNATLGGNANIAPVFNTATAYSKGDMVNYNGDLYVFTANHSAGAWTGSDAVQTKVSSELSSLRSGLTNMQYQYASCTDAGMDANTYYKFASLELTAGVFEGFFKLNKRGANKAAFTMKISVDGLDDTITAQYVFEGQYVYIILPFNFSMASAGTADIYIKSDVADGLAFGGVYYRKG